MPLPLFGTLRAYHSKVRLVTVAPPADRRAYYWTRSLPPKKNPADKQEGDLPSSQIQFVSTAAFSFSQWVWRHVPAKRLYVHSA